jgi:DNA-binding MarR family transcriptional regulator
MNMNDNPGFLLHKIGAMMEHISDKVLFEEFGIGFSQFKILFALEHHDGIRQKDIAGFLGQTEASISRQIKLLVAAKLVSVARGADDKKTHLITLTTRGRQIASDAFTLLNSHYGPVLSVLSPHDQLELASKLSKVHLALEASCNIYIQK